MAFRPSVGYPVAGVVLQSHNAVAFYYKVLYLLLEVLTVGVGLCCGYACDCRYYFMFYSVTCGDEYALDETEEVLPLVVYVMFDFHCKVVHGRCSFVFDTGDFPCQVVDNDCLVYLCQLSACHDAGFIEGCRFDGCQIFHCVIVERGKG